MATAAKKPAARPAPRGKPAPVQEEVQEGAGWEGTAEEGGVDAEDTSFGGGIIDEGNYEVIVVKAYFRESKTTQVEYINLELQVCEGDFDGRYLFMPFYVNSTSDNFRKGQKGFLAKWFLCATGAVPDEFPTTDDELADLVNTQVCVKVTIEENDNGQGKMVDQNRIVRVAATGEEPGKARAEAAEEQPVPAAKTPARNAPAKAPARPAAAAAKQQPSLNKPGAPKKSAASSFNDMNDDIPF